MSVSTTALALAVSGQARIFIVNNTGTANAWQLAASVSAALPAGTTFSSNCGATLAPGASCTVTVTPGATPSATPGDTAPSPARLALAGSNTNTLAVDVLVLAHGSVYQGGYVFAFDDTTPTSGSVGGKVAGLTDLSTGLRWAPVADPVPGAQSVLDGASNTAAIVASSIGTPDSAYAAGLCFASNAEGYADWYLPAVCEVSADTGAGCAAPAADNWETNLVASGAVPDLANGFFWTSTEFNLSPTSARAQRFDSGGNITLTAIKASLFAVRCARALTL